MFSKARSRRQSHVSIAGLDDSPSQRTPIDSPLAQPRPPSSGLLLPRGPGAPSTAPCSAPLPVDCSGSEESLREPRSVQLPMVSEQQLSPLSILRDKSFSGTLGARDKSSGGAGPGGPGGRDKSSGGGLRFQSGSGDLPLDVDSPQDKRRLPQPGLSQTQPQFGRRSSVTQFNLSGSASPTQLHTSFGNLLLGAGPAGGSKGSLGARFAPGRASQVRPYMGLLAPEAYPSPSRCSPD